MTFQRTPALRQPLAAVPAEIGLTRFMTLFLATSVGVIFLNVPAPQTLIAVIGPSIGLAPAFYGLVATAPLLGYAVGLFLVTPLADLLENRALITRTLGAATLFAAATPFVTHPAPFLALLFCLGLASAAVQMVVPLAAAMAPPDHRGRVVGDIMSGIMIGVLLSRPVASLVEHAFGWRVLYLMMAVALALVTVGLAWLLPRRVPAAGGGYGHLIASLLTLLRTERTLRHHALTAALGFAAFSVFWTAVALDLRSHFHLGQNQIALFALAGAGAAIIAPLAGRAGDHGWTRAGKILADVAGLLAFALAAFGDRLGKPWLGVGVLALSAIMLDMGVIGAQTLGRRAINLMRPEAGARLNGLFVGLFFIGGSIGSALVGPTWTTLGWPGICALGAAFAALALLSDVVGAG